MKTKFYSLVILALLTLFATTAWSANVVLKTDTETGDSYITIPASGTDVLNVSAGVTFKIYDDGGSNAYYSNNDDGYLQIVVPEGYTLQLNGSVLTSNDREDYLTVFDGNTDSPKLLDSLYTYYYRRARPVQNIVSSGNVMTLYFHSDARANDGSGVDLTAIVNPPNKTIAVSNSVSGGSIQSDKTQAAYGEIVTLTATPDAGYKLSGFDVQDESGNSLALDKNVVWESNTATFAMPNSNITVVPTFTNNFTSAGGLFVSVPKFGLKTVNIPDGVTSFNVKNYKEPETYVYSRNTNGYLMMTAPEGYGLLVSGRVNAHEDDYVDFTIFDGDSTASLKLVDARMRGATDLETQGSSGNTLTFRFHNNNDDRSSGLNLDVSVRPIRTITLLPSSGGSAQCVDQSVSGGLVTLTATPIVGYMLSGVDITDENGNALNVNVNVELDANIAQFVVPDANIRVTPRFTMDFSAEGGLYTNLPLKETKSLYIPEGVTSFKLYDDGGVSENYSVNADGYLILHAPEGYRIKLSGNVTLPNDSYDFVRIYDGQVFNSADLMYSMQSTSVDVASSGNVAMVHLHSNYTRCAGGLDLTVTIIDANATHAVTLSEGITGGSVDIEPTSAVYGTTVSLNMTPSSGNLLDTVIVTAEGSPVQVSGGSWRTSNTATFSMPYSDVTVTPVFTGATAEAGASVKMPTSGWKYVNVPEEAVSFKVYDNGGENGKYSNNANGYLVFNIPDGFALVVTGSVSISINTTGDYFSIYDGSSTGATALLSKIYGDKNIGSVVSSGDKLLLHFHSDSDKNASGLDLTVTVINKSAAHAVTLSEGVSGGTVEVDPTSATFGTTVTLTATPASGYMLNDYTILANGSPVDFVGGWYVGNTATFTMPYADVSITPTFTNDLTADGGLSVNMPVTGTKTANIPAGVTSFKVYDNGGSGANYGNNSIGYLVLNAPEGYIMEVTGTMFSGDYQDFFEIHDGESRNNLTLFSGSFPSSSTRNIGTVVSSGRTLMFYCYSNASSNGEGLDLTVTLLDATVTHTVTLDEGVVGGTVSIEPSNAALGTLVTVTVTSAEGKVLDDVLVDAANGRTVPIEGGNWMTGNVATFTMPYSDVIVTPVFSNEVNDLSVNVPGYGTEYIDVAAGITSFKVYDIGGPDGNYDSYSDGYLVLTAPEGYALQVTGSITTDAGGDYLTIYDGDSDSSPELLSQKSSASLGKTTDIGVHTSSTNVMMLYFHSDDQYQFAGLNLSASVVPPQIVSITPVQGGSVSSVGSAFANQTVTLTAVPDEGYVLSGFTAYSNGNAVNVNFKKWDNTATFVMPNGAVSITPAFSPAGELAVNMPVSGIDTVIVPAGVTSFKVYDDGGNAANYSNSANGYVLLIAPEGRLLRVNGTLTAEGTKTDNLTIYDGDNSAILLNAFAGASNGVAADIGTVWSIGNKVKLFFKSDNTVNFAGLDLTVTVEDPSVSYNVVLNDAVGGSIAANYTSAPVGTSIVVTATPETGYLLSGVSVVDSDGNSVVVTGGEWYSADTAIFVMPSSNVSVTPVFSNALTAEDGLSVNFPVSGTKLVRIPASVTSFNIYDDGGKDDNYSNNAEGYLELVAPENKRMNVSVTSRNLQSGDALSYYNSSYWQNLSNYSSSGNTVKLRFSSDASANAEGVELQVTTSLMDSVTVASVEGGTVTCDQCYRSKSWIVNLAVTPDANHLLKSISIETSTGSTVALLERHTLSSFADTLSFSMPDKSVTVTPEFTDNLTAEGGVFINMPKTGADTVLIPEGVTSFKVYDDGGKDYNYKSNSNGYLVLMAPEGRLIHVSGSLSTYYSYDYLTIYDGSTTTSTKLLDKKYGDADIDLISSGNSLMLYFYSDGTSKVSSGIDFTVTVENPNEEFSVTLGSSSNGTASVNPETAAKGTSISVTATPDANYIFMGVSVVDAANNNVLLPDGKSWLDNTATFVMPYSDVTVTPVFLTDATAEDGVSINMPVSGTRNVVIPACVKSFNVYDDGGSDGNQTLGASGTLELVAPDGYLLQVAGTMNAKSTDVLSIIDGDESSTELARGIGSNIVKAVMSSGNKLSISYNTTSAYAGFALTVTLLEAATPHSVTIETAVTGGSIVSNVASAAMGDVVTLSASNDEDYILMNVIVTKPDGTRVTVNGGIWTSNNSASFIMPYSDVVVTPVFAKNPGASDGLLLIIPQTGTTSVQIPEGVVSFGVKNNSINNAYHAPADGYLKLTAPSGYALQVTGTRATEAYDFLDIYDGLDTSSDKLYDGVGVGAYSGSNIGTYTSTGNEMTLYFSANSTSQNGRYGVDLIVSIVSQSEEHVVTLSDGVVGGTVAIEPANATLGTLVTLTPSPASGNMLKEIVATDAEGNNVKINGDCVFSGSCQFAMPASDVSVAALFTSDLSAEGGLYVNMPTTGIRSIDIPSSVKSFNVYGDGGKDGDYSIFADGYLQLNAPDGYVLRLAGSVRTYDYTDYLIILDGAASATDTLMKKAFDEEDGIDLTTSGNVTTFYFHSIDNSPRYSGPNFVVTLVDTTLAHEVVVAQGIANGSVVTDVASATYGSTVSLTATPASNYLTASVSALAAGEPVAVDGGVWYNNVATFSMPYSDVEVSATFTDDLTADGGLYVNMPKTGTTIVQIPAGVESFKVYDNGGPSGKYATNVRGYLKLLAPMGYVLQITGTVKTDSYYDFLTIYDGEISASTLLLNRKCGSSDADIETLTSTNNVVTLYFETDGSYLGDGLDLLVALVPSSEHHLITVNNVDNGSVQSDKEDALVGDTVTLTALPEDGFYLSGDVLILGCNDDTLAYTGGWYTNNQVTFVMPGCDVTVEHSFGRELSVDLPATGSKTVRIPDGVTSFNVYDNGGKNRNYSKVANGYLELVAPENYIMHVSGVSTLGYYDSLIVYDASAQIAAYRGTTNASAEFWSETNVVGLYLKSNPSYATGSVGLDITVDLHEKTSVHNVVVADGVSGGSVAIEPAQALLGDTVSLTATSDEGYYLSGIDAIDENGDTLVVTDGWWFTGNVAKFVMPFANVTVTPHFVQGSMTDDARYINMPVTGKKIVNIPANVNSIKVYDDGGADGNYSNSANGQLVLVAPEDCVLLIEGDVNIGAASYNNDRFVVYDGDSTLSNKQIWSTSAAFESQRSLGNVVLLRFYSDASNNSDGLDLTITVKNASEVDEVTVSEGGSVNMPWRGTILANIPDDVTTFHVYDDGGPDGNYREDGFGYLVLAAPEGRLLRLAGSMVTRQYWDKLTIFDGSTSSPKLLDAQAGDMTVGPLVSSGNTLTLYLDAQSGDYAGIDFEVDVINLSAAHTVTVASADNGSVDVVGETEYSYGDTVTLVATPNENYVFKGVSIDANGTSVSAIGVPLSEIGTVRFVMPDADVEVTPVFGTSVTADDEVYVTIPVSGHKNVSIPAGVTSFKVYDDGGKYAGSSDNATGILELVAPNGYALRMTGSVELRLDYRCGTQYCYNFLDVRDGSIGNSSTSLFYERGYSLSSSENFTTYDLGTLTSSGNIVSLELHTTDDRNHRGPASGLDMTVELVYIGLDYHVTFDVTPIKDNDSYLVLGHGDLWKTGNLEKVMNSEDGGHFLHLYEYVEDDEESISGFNAYKWSPVLEADEDDEAILASYSLTPAIMTMASSNEDPLSINLYPSYAGSFTSGDGDFLPVYAYVDGNRVQDLLDYHGNIVLSQTLGGKKYSQKSFTKWPGDDVPGDVVHQALNLPFSMDGGDTLVFDVSVEADNGYMMFIDEFVDDWREPVGGDPQDPPAGEGWGYDADTKTLKIAPEYMPNMEFKVHYELLPYNVTFDIPTPESGVFVANKTVDNVVSMDWFDNYTGLTMHNAPAPAVYNANGCRIAWKVKGRNVEVREGSELVEEIPFMVSTMDDASAVNELELDLQHPVCPNMDNGTGPTYLQTMQVDEGNGKLVLVQKVGETVISHDFVDNQMSVPVHEDAGTKNESGVTLQVVAVPDPGYVLKQLTYDMVVDGNSITALVQDSASVNVKQSLAWHVKFSNYEPVYVAYDLSLGAEDSSYVWLPVNAAWNETLAIPYDGSATEMWRPYREDRCFAGWTKDLNDAYAPVYTEVDFMSSGEFSKNAAEPTMLYAVWKAYGGNCSYPSTYTSITPRYYDDVQNPSSYVTIFSDTLVVTQKLDNVVFVHKGLSLEFGNNPYGYKMSLGVLPEYGHELDTSAHLPQVTMLNSGALVLLEGDDEGAFILGSNEMNNEDCYVGYKDMTTYKVVLSTNAGGATVFYGDSWASSAAIRVGEHLPDGNIFRRDACFSGWSFDPDEMAEYSFDYDNRLFSFGTSLLQQRAERQANGLNVDTLFAKWDTSDLSCMDTVVITLAEEYNKNATVSLYQNIDGSDVKVLELGTNSAAIPVGIWVSHNYSSYEDFVNFSKAVVTPKSGATLSDNYQLSYVDPSDADEISYEITEQPFSFTTDAELRLQGLTRNTYNVVYHENAGDANVFYGENWNAEVSLTTDDPLNYSLYRADKCVAGWSFEGDQTKYRVADAEFVAAYEARVAAGTSTDLYAVWSDNVADCGTIETFTVTLSNDLKGISTVELIQTVGGEPKVVATVGEEGISIPKMQATVMPNEGMTLVVGENGYFSGIRIVPATGYELVEGVNPSYKIGNADAVEVTDATPAWLITDATELSGAVTSTGYTIAFNENAGNANVFYPADWSETGSYNIVDNDGTVFPKLYRTDKCLVGYGFNKDASRDQSFQKFDTTFVMAYDSVVATGVASPVLYGVWNECTQALYTVTLNDIAEGTLVLSHNGKAYNVPSTGFVVPEATPALEFGLAFTPNLGYKLADEGSFNLVNESGVIQSVIENNTLAVDGDKIVDAPVVTLENTFAFVTNAGDAVLFYGDDWVESALYSLDAQNVDFPKGIYRVDSCFKGWALNTESDRTHLQFNTEFLDDVEATRNAGLPVDRLYAIWGACETEQTIVTVANADSLSGTFTLSRKVSQTAKTYTVAGTALQVPADEALTFAVTFVPNKGYTYDETVGITAVDATDVPVSMNAGELVVATSLTLSAAATADTYTFAFNENAGDANVFYTGSLATEFTAKMIDDAATRAFPMNLYRSDACLEGWNFSTTAMVGFSQLDDEFVDAYNDFVAAGNDAPTTLYAVWNENCHQTLYTVSSFDKRKGTLMLAQGSREFVVDTAGLKVPSVAGGLAFTATFTPAAGYAYDAAQGLEAFNNMSQSMGVLTDGALTVTKTTVLKAVSLTASTYELAFNVNAGNATVYYGDAWRAGTEQTSFSFANAGDFPSDIYRTDSCLAGWTLSTSATAGVFTEFSGEFVDSVAAMDNFDGKLFAKWGNCIAVNNVTVAQVTSAAGTLTLKQTDASNNVLNTINIDDAEVTLPLGNGDVTFDVSFTVGEGYSLVDGDYFYTVNANGKNVQALLGNKLTLSGNTLLRAPILSDAYTITFNTNAGDANVFYGASWISEGQFSMEMNEVARTFPTEVYRVGYTLAGWSLNPADNSGDYVFDTDLATALKESGKAQVTLYAVWTATTSQQTYTITLADAAAGYLTASQTVDKTTATFRVGEEGLEVPAVTGGLTFSVKSTMNAGYFADGEKLYLLAAGGARIDSLAGDNGVLVVDADKVVEIPYESDGVEFVFNENTDAHVFYEDGWTGSGAFALNGDTAFPTGILRTEGKLLGWALSRTSTKYYTAYNGTFVNDLKNYKALGLPTGTLYAVWSEYGLFDNVNVTNGNQKNGSFVITQTVNGVETEPITVNANGIMIPYSANGLTFNVKFETKPGYSLNAEQAISGANAAGTSIGSSVNGGTLVFKSNTDVVLSASVGADRFKFDYNVNGGDAYVFYGTDWSGADDKSLNDTSVVFPTNIYRNDACLLGWSVDPADTVGSKILTSDFIATLDRVQNVNTLYAVWKECEVETYTVTFANTNVGSLVLSQDVDDTLVTFPVEEEGLEVPVVPGGLRFRAAYTLKAGYAGNTDTLYVVDDISGLLTTLADNALTVNENIVLAIPTVGETFKLVFDVNREGRLFYGSDWIDSAIYMLSDKKSVIPLPNYVYTSGACMVGWSMDSTGGDTYLKFNTDLAAALLENRSADSTYKLYAIWGEGADCDDLYDRITLTSKNGTVHLAEAPRGDKTEFIEHEFMSDGTIILPKTMNGNYIRVFAVPDSSFMLDSLVMTREGSDGERQVFFEGDALVYNLMDAKFEAFFGKSNRTEVAFVGAEVIKLGNAIRFAFGTSEFEVTRKVAVSVRLETIDGELVAEDTVIDSIPRPYNGEWDKFPLAAGKYVLTATIGDESESDEFVETFEVEAEIATVSEDAWQIISIGNLDKDAMVWDDDARFYWWDETSGSGDYWQYKEFNPEDEIVPTRGYWYSSLEGRPLVLKPESDIEVADKVEWKLDSVSSGWNLVANPYGFALDLFADHPAEKADQTDSSGVTFWRWDANIADYVPAFIVQPYEAVWVKVSAPTDWTIPVAPQFDTDVTDSTVDEDSTDDATLKAISKARRLTKANGKNDWRLQMVLSDTRGHKDSWNMLGASHNAFTTEEPPEGMGDHVKLSIVEGNRMLAKSVKAPADEQDWSIALSANTERYGELSFKGVDDINALGLKVFVTVDGKTTEMHDGMPLRVLLKPGATVAKVHVGAGMKVVASASLNSLRALQSGTIMNVSFEASDNLAGSRTIVELVNMDGKVVASRNASAVAGMNQVALDAPKPGIYMLRVRAGSQMRAGRVLVR